MDSGSDIFSTPPPDFHLTEVIARLAEDACLSRNGNAPANNALCNCIALAAILERGDGKVAEAMRHFELNRQDAFRAVL